MTYPSLTSILVGALFGATVAFLAFKARALNCSGAFTAAILGTLVFGFGGVSATFVLLTFFISSSGMSFLFKRNKAGVSEKHAKGSRRDAWQVLANGGVSGVMIVLSAMFPQFNWHWWAFCASLAAANADTWATELGVLSPIKPRLITTWKQVEMGTSGGITPVGTLSSLLGSFLVALVGYLSSGGSGLMLVAITLLGFAGSLVDSVLGATVQAVYHCPTCRKETERHPLHVCGTKTTIIRGFPWLNNDWVNGFCTFTPVIVLFILNLFD
jgi:uncharacterized protein (TIGR00297 family)